MPNPFAHIELNTDNVKKSKKFYQALFAWKLNDMPGQDYTMIDVGKGTGGGMAKHPIAGAPSMWLPYVEVDDVKKTLAKASKAGGTVSMGYTEIGTMGAIGVLLDPSGAAFGVWEMGKSTPAPKAAKKKPAAKSKPKKKAKAKKA
jgi:uncharacterized protein